MAFEIPTSLIREVQIALRNQAGLSSYDPDDPSLPGIPSLEDLIAEFDPSPPYLQCKQCRGRLLRGLESMVCVFCGAQQRRDLPPEPISFKNTFACRWLLESLDLDGSEAVNLASGENDSNKGQNAQSDELVLSDLLDIELNWPSEPQRTESGLTGKSPSENKVFLNLAGVDLDNFFSGAKEGTDLSRLREPVVANKQIESTEGQAFTGQGDLNLFKNVGNSSISVNSVITEGDTGDQFSDWEAEFQSASSGTLPVDTKSFDPFPVSSAIDFSSSMEVSFGMATDLKSKVNRTDNDVKPNEGPVPLPSIDNNWIQDDLWSTPNVRVSSNNEQFEVNNKPCDAEQKVVSNGLSFMSDNWIQDDLWKGSHIEAPKNEKMNEDDDWQDFTGSGNMTYSFPNSSKQTASITVQSDEQASQTNLMGLSNSFHEMDLRGFPPNLFSGVSSTGNSSMHVNNVQLEASISDRFADVGGQTEWNPNKAANGDESHETNIQSETADPDVEMLISQMHDLSFMLESNLSIPKNVHGFDSVL
ncbi:PREDICTED: uncharacterized protein LOC104599096 [Nelumbo nucifera]|uniref:Uncharacterized protein LOC104599096 n=1 Tax=Nelumbo nucifera TaxID=4432 RepID=A0A1U8A4K8_NELNU|nr:PREDICTED: uncharacterized protein LOC104599096 [Nelumbo nucifera]